MDNPIRVLVYFSALQQFDVLLTTASVKTAEHWVRHLRQQGKNAYFEKTFNENVSEKLTGEPSDDTIGDDIPVFMYYSALNRYEVLLTATSETHAMRWVRRLQQQGKDAYYETPRPTLVRSREPG